MGGMPRSRLHRLTVACAVCVILYCCCGAHARFRPGTWQQKQFHPGRQQGGYARRLVQAGATATVTNGAKLAAALAGSASVIQLSENIVRLRQSDLAQYGGTVRIDRPVNVTSANPSQPAAVDFSGIVDAVHVGPLGQLDFYNCVVQGFASPFQPAAAKLTERIQGQGSWPTFTADPGADFGGFNVTVYSLLPDCSTFASASLARAKQILGNSSVELLGPSTILIKNDFRLQLPIIVRATNQTVGNVTTRFENAVSICLTDTFAPGNESPAPSDPAPGGGGTPWWVWLLVAAAAIVIIALVTLLLLTCRRRRRAARQLSLAPPAPKDSQESLDSPSRTAVNSAMEQRILTGAFDDLTAKAAAAAAPSTVASSDASAAEAALLEAWRSRQLSSDRAADEVELGPMIGRGGFGQVHKARWRGALVAVKIVNHVKGDPGKAVRDIRVLRETLFSTALLHPNIVVTYKIITIPSPDPLERPSQSTSGDHASGRSSAVHSNNTNSSSGGALQQLREEGSVRGNSLSDRAAAFATAAAAQQPGDGGPGATSGQQQQQDSQDLRSGSAPVQTVSVPDSSASGRFTTTSDGYRKRHMSVRIDPEAEIDEEEYMAGDVETLAETWMLMEYCDRGSLEKGLHHDVLRNKADGRVDLVKLYKTLMDIAAGMQYLHSANILHGDLKLGNILLKSTATDLRGFIAKICDFGMSRLMDASKSHVSTSSMGTISYQPPELLLGQGLSKACDVYAFGIIMFELFAGEAAFQGANLGHLIFQIVHKRERPPIPADCPVDYTELMQSCWQNDAPLRPTFKDVLASLQAQFGVLRGERAKRGPGTPTAAPAAAPATSAAAASDDAPPNYNRLG